MRQRALVGTVDNGTVEKRNPPSSVDTGPLIIGHRGASGHRPEHTVESYRLAVELGADYIEPDLVCTRDGHLVARHENEISGTTDVAEHPEFADRRATKTVDGVTITGWFTEDLTLAELRTLRAVERIPAVRPHNTIYNGLFPVPTLQEIIDLARAESARVGRTIGVYPETKHPSYFRSIGLALEPRLAAILRRNNLAHRDAPVFLQSFEPGSLRTLRSLVDTPSIQLIDAEGAPFDFVTAADPRRYADLATPAGLDFVRRYADGVGVAKDLVIRWDAGPTPTELIDDAHARGLLVHAWTFRNENTFLPEALRGSADPAAWGDTLTEYRTFLAAGLDGLFTDHADTAYLARSLMTGPEHPEARRGAHIPRLSTP
jgi:glycerophosphoryl diester phosphodiesterase